MEQFFYPILTDNEENRKKILQILKYEVSHSGIRIKDEELENYSKDLAGICFKKDKCGKLFYNFEAAVIANFMQDIGGEE